MRAKSDRFWTLAQATASEANEATEKAPEEEQQTEESVRQIDATWSCEVRASDNEPSVAIDNLYVGDRYLVHCKGDFVEGFASDQLQLGVFNPEQNYTVSLLKTRTFDGRELWAEATSYKPGEHSFEGLVLTDGLQNIALSGEKPILIRSALAERPQAEAMNPESQAIALLGPFPLALPFWLWILLFAVVFAVAGAIWRSVSKRLQKKRLVEELSKHSTALTPYNQFHKEIRAHIRSHTGPSAALKSPSQFLRDLDRSFRMFLVREFLIPANEWKTSAVMSELKGRHKKIYRYAGPQVRKLLIELDRAKEAAEKNKPEDCEQMLEMSRRVVNQIKKIRQVSSS